MGDSLQGVQIIRCYHDIIFVWPRRSLPCQGFDEIVGIVEAGVVEAHVVDLGLTGIGGGGLKHGWLIRCRGCKMGGRRPQSIGGSHCHLSCPAAPAPRVEHSGMLLLLLIE